MKLDKDTIKAIKSGLIGYNGPEEDLEEELLTAEDTFFGYSKARFNVFTSPYEVKGWINNIKQAGRVFIDENDSLYLCGNAFEVTHINMIDTAQENGYSTEFDYYDKKQISIIISKYDKLNIPYITEDDAADDMYEYEYIYDNMVIYSDKKFNSFSLYKILGGAKMYKISLDESLETNKVERPILKEEYQPKKVGKAYKVFRIKDGKLYPPMVANKDNKATPIGKWLEAEEGEFAGLSKTGRPQVKSSQGGTLSYRPGWHLGEIPRASQFDRKNKETDEFEFPKDFIWAECDYVMDVDYQKDSDEQGHIRTKINDKGEIETYFSDKYQHSLAGLHKLPKNGYYKYRTNPNQDTIPWIITGAMKVNRLLDDFEVNKILKQNGLSEIHRQGGDKTLEELGFSNELDEEIVDVNDYLFDTKLNEYEYDNEIGKKREVNFAKINENLELLHSNAKRLFNLLEAETDKLYAILSLSTDKRNIIDKKKYKEARKEIKEQGIAVRGRWEKKPQPFSYIVETTLDKAKEYAKDLCQLDFVTVKFKDENDFIANVYTTTNNETYEDYEEIESSNKVVFDKKARDCDGYTIKDGVAFSFGLYGNEDKDAFQKLNEDIELSTETDSEGNQLSKQQVEYFKNSAVRTKDNKLSVCRHGTDAEFDEFDADFIGDDNKGGIGFYFVKDSNLTHEYKNPKTCYINIEKPISDTSSEISDEKWEEFCKACDIYLGGLKASSKNSSDFELYQRLSDIYDGSKKEFLKNTVEILDRDGIIWHNQYQNDCVIIFKPNQAKLITNQTPTLSNKVNEVLTEKIVKKGDKWQVQSMKGKNLGTYDTKEEAEKRLKQVEYFKNLKETLNSNISEIKDNFNIVSNVADLESDKGFILEDGSIVEIDDVHDELFDMFLESDVDDPVSTLNVVRFELGCDGCEGYATLPINKINLSQMNSLLDVIKESSFRDNEFTLQIGWDTNDWKTYDLSEMSLYSIQQQINNFYRTHKFKENLKEEILTSDAFDVIVSNNPYEVKNILLKSKEPMRVCIDEKQNLYLIGYAYETVHRNMIGLAIDNGYDLKFDDYFNLTKNNKNTVCILYSPLDKYNFPIISEEAAIEDDYTYECAYDRFIVYSRYNKFSDFELSKILGKFEEREIFEEESLDETLSEDEKARKEKIEQLISDLYKLRQESIKKDGEFGIGNLVFKEMRNLDYLDKLKDELVRLESKDLSLESLNEEYLTSNDTFKFDNRVAWCGSVNAYDGNIEEVINYRNAERNDFHHSFMFSENQVEKIDNEDCLFFYVDERGNIIVDPYEKAGQLNKQDLISKIKEQITIINKFESLQEKIVYHEQEDEEMISKGSYDNHQHINVAKYIQEHNKEQLREATEVVYDWNEEEMLRVLEKALSMSDDELISRYKLVLHDDMCEKGPAFILPNGRFIWLSDYCEKLKEHIDDIIHRRIFNYLVMQEAELQEKTFDVDIWWELDTDDAIEKALQRGWIRCNSGSTNVEDRFYCVLPSVSIKPTNDQYDSLIKFFELGQIWKRQCLVFCGHQYKWYNLAIDNPKYIIFRIKEYYSSGYLYEAIGEGYKRPEKYYSVTDDEARWTSEGEDIYYWGSEADDWAEDYAKSYKCTMSPKDFLDLTTEKGAESLKLGDKLWNELRELDVDEFTSQAQPIFLNISFNNKYNNKIAQVVGHEGRHRMFALMLKGVKKVDVELKCNEYDTLYNKYKPFDLKYLTLFGQFDKNVHVTVTDLKPMSWKRHQEIRPNVRELKKYKENLNESKVFRFPTETLQHTIDFLYKDRNANIEKVSVKKLVDDNDLLNTKLSDYHKKLWDNKEDKDFHIDANKTNSLRASETPTVVRDKRGNLSIIDGKHRIRALYNDGYDEVELIVLNEAKKNKNKSIVTTSEFAPIGPTTRVLESEEAKITLEEVVDEFKIIDNALDSEAVYILNDGRVMNTQGHYENEQHINVAHFVEVKTKQRDTYLDGSLFMIKQNAIRFTTWIPAFALPLRRLSKEQEDTLTKIINKLTINSSDPLMISDAKGTQQIEFYKNDAHYILSCIRDYYRTGILSK